jgi:hypothetical protein
MFNKKKFAKDLKSTPIRGSEGGTYDAEGEWDWNESSTGKSVQKRSDDLMSQNHIKVKNDTKNTFSVRKYPSSEYINPKTKKLETKGKVKIKSKTI